MTMERDIQDLLQALLDPVDAADRSSQVIAGVRHRKRLRLAALGTLFACVAAIGALVVPKSAVGDRVSDVTPAGPSGHSTYAFSGFRIEYPYDDPRADVEPDPRIASVSFRSDWTGDEYPGHEENCSVTLMGTGGEVVGVIEFSHGNQKSGSRIVSIEGKVSAPPINAEAACS